MGVMRTLDTIAAADLTLVVLDSSRRLDKDDQAVLEQVQDRPHLVVINNPSMKRFRPLNPGP